MSETKIPHTEKLLQDVKLYSDIIDGNINDFIMRKIPRKINKDFSRIFWDAVREERDLKETLTELKKLYETIPVLRSDYNGGRSASRVRQINKWLNQLLRKKDLKYLDVGCSEASITQSIAEALLLEKGYIHGCDIFIEDIPESKVVFSKSTHTSLPYEDKEFDLVTTFQALHHFTEPRLMLSEIHRVLKPGGVYIIREHDVRNPSFGIYLDVVHAIYSTVVGCEMTPEIFETTYKSFYHSKEHWSRNYIIPVGFRFGGLVKTKDRFNSYYARYYKI